MRDLPTDQHGSADLHAAGEDPTRRLIEETPMLSIVTDEISYDPEAFHELVPSLRKTHADIRFVAVSPGLFKLALDHWAVAHHGGAKLDASFRLAEQVGCRLVVIFGFERVRRHVRHMHYKAVDTPELGGGKPGWDFGWAPKLKALAADGYAGNISVETHAKPRLERSETTLAALRRVLAEAGVAE
jgi:sugar phosphate isomerase/epimerase